MNNYIIEHKIVTLTANAVMEKDKKPATFIQDDIEFSHWDFNYADGWPKNQWLCQINLTADNYKDAINIFRLKLQKIIPRISLIGQSYIEFINQPFLLLNKNYDAALIRYIRDGEPVGLMFMEEELEALQKLMNNITIPEEFYYYWNDAVNSIGYSSKLLLMFSAIESLAKNKDKEKYYKKIKTILGTDLTEDLFGTKDNPEKGLRQRLVHGEYFTPDDSRKDYIEIIHKKIIQYFNLSIFNKTLLHEDVVSPQRNIFDNKEDSWFFIESMDKDIKNLHLKNILEDIDKNIGTNKLEKYILFNNINERLKVY